MDPAASLSELLKAGLHSEVVKVSSDLGVSPGVYPLASKILAASYFHLGEYDSAFSILSDLESSYGEDVDYLTLFASTCRRLGNLDQASDLFSKALKKDPHSLPLKNNYSNLLIDLGKYDEAKLVLDSILKVDSSYNDAITNRNRLNTIISTLNTDTSTSESHQFSSQLVVELGDPLLLAFANDEVEYSTQRYFPPQTKSDPNFNFNNLVEPDPRSVALEQLKVAEATLESGDMISVLKICSKILSTLGQDARIYDIASDAYLNLNKISQSELCLLHAVALGGHSPKRCFNLASFAMMRSNFGLAESYLNNAAAIDPSSEHLAKLRAILADHKSKFDSQFVFHQIWSEPDATKK